MYFSNSEFLRERDSSLLVDFFWHTIGVNNFVIDTIKFGYRIPFISIPCRALFRNNKSAFVESAISELVGNHSVIEVPLSRMLLTRSLYIYNCQARKGLFSI